MSARCQIKVRGRDRKFHAERAGSKSMRTSNPGATSLTIAPSGFSSPELRSKHAKGDSKRASPIPTRVNRRRVFFGQELLEVDSCCVFDHLLVIIDRPQSCLEVLTSIEGCA